MTRWFSLALAGGARGVMSAFAGDDRTAALVMLSASSTIRKWMIRRPTRRPSPVGDRVLCPEHSSLSLPMPQHWR